MPENLSSIIKKISKKFDNSSFILKRRKNSLWSLNFTQFFGAINDNLYKLLLAFLFINTFGEEKASLILATAGAVYVLPFLLFSSSAGIIADRISKQKMIIFLKGFEVFTMLLVVLAFYYKNLVGCYTLLFLLATHSAVFGPAKYGIIPEVVTKENVSKANGIITAFTYIAVILGTFLASFMTEITNKNFFYASFSCLLIAISGFISSLFIEKTPAFGSKRKINPLFISEIIATLSQCKKIPYLNQAIFGSAFFLFIGAFAQLNIIPYAIQSLKLSDVAGGYLFLILAVGIAIGSVLCGKLIKNKLELGISCLSCAGLGLGFILLSISSFSLIFSIICLFLLGIFGGMMIIPFDTFSQINSPEEKRGQVMATVNFLSFVGVLMASIVLFIFGSLLNIPAAVGFFLVGILTLATSFILTIKLSGATISYISKKLIMPFSNTVILENDEVIGKSLIVLENANVHKALILLAIYPNLHFLLPARKQKPFWYKFISSMTEIKNENTQEEIIENAKSTLASNDLVCLLLRDEIILPPKKTNSIQNIFNKDKTFMAKINKGKDKKNYISIKKI